MCMWVFQGKFCAERRTYELCGVCLVPHIRRGQEEPNKVNQEPVVSDGAVRK